MLTLPPIRELLRSCGRGGLIVMVSLGRSLVLCSKACPSKEPLSASVKRHQNAGTYAPIASVMAGATMGARQESPSVLE